MILTGETEVLGEKHYTLWVVGKWWNDTDRGRLKCWEKNYEASVVDVNNFHCISCIVLQKDSYCSINTG